MNCQSCEGELTQSRANSRYDWLICLNWRCPLHHHPQQYIERWLGAMVAEASPVKPKKKLRKRSYLHYLEGKKENYRALRAQGVKSRLASNSASHKGRARMEEQLTKRRMKWNMNRK